MTFGGPLQIFDNLGGYCKLSVVCALFAKTNYVSYFYNPFFYSISNYLHNIVSSSFEINYGNITFDNILRKPGETLKCQ